MKIIAICVACVLVALMLSFGIVGICRVAELNGVTEYMQDYCTDTLVSVTRGVDGYVAVEQGDNAYCVYIVTADKEIKSVTFIHY